MDRYPYFKYTILLGATRALAHIGIHFTHRVFGLSQGQEQNEPQGGQNGKNGRNYVPRPFIKLGDPFMML